MTTHVASVHLRCVADAAQLRRVPSTRAVATTYVRMPAGVTFQFGMDWRQDDVATLTRIESTNEGP